MIGKPMWFRRRKYTGWGLTPVTWQGWVYTLVLILPIVLLANFGVMTQPKIIAAIIWALIFCADFIHIMINMPKDERDRIHEAIAERNALWMIVLVLGVGIAYEVAVSVSKNIMEVDPFILIALFAGLAVKLVTNVYLDRKN